MISSVERALDTVNVVYDRLGDVLVATFDAAIEAYYLPVAVDIRESGSYLVTRAFLIGDIPAEAMHIVSRYALEVSGQLAGAKVTVESGALLVQAEAKGGNEPGATALELLRRTLLATRVVLLETITLATDPNVCALVSAALSEREPRRADGPRPAGDLVTISPSSINNPQSLDGRSALEGVAVVRLVSDEAEA